MPDTIIDLRTGQECEVLSRKVVSYPKRETEQQRKAREDKGEPMPHFSFTVTQIKLPQRSV